MPYVAPAGPQAFNQFQSQPNISPPRVNNLTPGFRPESAGVRSAGGSSLGVQGQDYPISG